MKTFRTFMTIIFVPLLIISSAMTLLSGLLRFAVLNPNYYKRNLADKAYCEEMLEYINEDLNHIEILYGLEDGALEGLIGEEDIKSYTALYIDAVFALDQTGGVLQIPQYPNNAYVNYMLSNSPNSYEAAVDFGEDCSEVIESHLSAVTQPMLLDNVTYLLQNKLVVEFTALFAMLLGLTVGLSVLLVCCYIGKIKSGLIALSGSLFCGTSLVFAPLWMFNLKGYTERLNIAPSPYRTQLVGILDSFLGGGASIAGIILLVCLAVLIPCCIIGKKSKNRAK